MVQYIIGSKEHSKEIRDHFISLNMKNAAQFSYDMNILAYFVNPVRDVVDAIRTDSWNFAAFKKSGVFEELKHPYNGNESSVKAEFIKE